MRKVVIAYRIPSFPCIVNTIEFVFASEVLAFLKSPPRIVCFVSEELRSIM